MLGGLQSKQFDAISWRCRLAVRLRGQRLGQAIYDVLDKAAWAKRSRPLPTTALYALKTTIDQHADVTQPHQTT